MQISCSETRKFSRFYSADVTALFKLFKNTWCKYVGRWIFLHPLSINGNTRRKIIWMLNFHLGIHWSWFDIIFKSTQPFFFIKSYVNIFSIYILYDPQFNEISILQTHSRALSRRRYFRETAKLTAVCPGRQSDPPSFSPRNIFALSSPSKRSLNSKKFRRT